MRKLLFVILALSSAALAQPISSGSVKPGNCATAINFISKFAVPGCTPVTPLLTSLYFSDVNPQSPKRGSLIFATGKSPRWSQLFIGNPAQVLMGGREPHWGMITGYNIAPGFTVPSLTAQQVISGVVDLAGSSVSLGNPGSSACRGSFDLVAGKVVFTNSSGGSCAPAMPYRVATDYCTTPGVYDVSCFVNGAKSGTMLYAPGVTYRFATQPELANLSDFTLMLDPGAVLLGVTGISGQALLSFSGTNCTDISIVGRGTIDGGNLAAVGIDYQCTTGSDRFRVSDVEVRHVTGANGLGIQNISNTGVFVVDDSRVEDITPTDASAKGIEGSDASYFEAMRNHISNIGGDAIYALTPDFHNIAENYVFDVAKAASATTSAIHMDTGWGGVIARNTVDTSGNWGIFPEVSPFEQLVDNIVRNTGGYAYQAGAGGTAPSALTNSINVLDATTGFTAGANVTLTADAADKQQGTGSLQAVTNGSFTTGTMFYYNFGSRNVTYGLNAQIEQLWVKSTVALNNGQLSLVLSHSGTFTTQDLVYPIPYIPAATWVFVGNLWAGGWGEMTGNATGVWSWGIVANTATTSATLHFDDYKITKGTFGYTVRGNKAYMPGSYCMVLGLVGGEVDNNYCEDPMNNGSATRFGYYFSSSTDTKFLDNEVNYTAKTGITSVGYQVDAATTIWEAGFKTNATNYNGITAGGKVYGLGRTGQSMMYTGDNPAAGATTGDMTVSRASNSGVLFIGTDGTQIYRSGSQWAINNGYWGLAAPTTTYPSLNFPSGTAPTTPVAGDWWRDANGTWAVDATGVAACNILTDSTQSETANNIKDCAPSSVTTAYQTNRPGAAKSGVQFGVNASNVITQNFSGDTAHALSQTAKTAAVTTFTLCAATAGTACGQVGQYRISYNFWGSGTACSSVTAGSVGLNLTWTDENAVAHTTISLPLWDQKTAAMTNGLFNFNTALGTEGASGSYIISTNGTIIQAATTYTACTTGTGTYNLKMTVEQLQ